MMQTNLLLGFLEEEVEFDEEYEALKASSGRHPLLGGLGETDTPTRRRRQSFEKKNEKKEMKANEIERYDR